MISSPPDVITDEVYFAVYFEFVLRFTRERDDGKESEGQYEGFEMFFHFEF